MIDKYGNTWVEKTTYKCIKSADRFCPLCRMGEMQDFYSNDKNYKNAWKEGAD